MSEFYRDATATNPLLIFAREKRLVTESPGAFRNRVRPLAPAAGGFRLLKISSSPCAYP